MATSSEQQHLSYSKSKVPLFGALIDYLESSMAYIRNRSFTEADKLHPQLTRSTLSGTFMAITCLILGLTSNIKFEVVTVDEQPLPDDLHVMLLSKEHYLYIDDIDSSKVLWSIELSDFITIFVSCLFILSSSRLKSPLSEYAFLPWLGATLRGLMLRQGPTAWALLYAMTIVEGRVNIIFLTTFVFMFILECRMYLEIGRVIHLRWERRNQNKRDEDNCTNVETLWTEEDAGNPSIEINNYVYK